MKVLDLCSGTGSATCYFDDVTHVDISKKFKPEIVCDIRKFHTEKKYDFIWASPPCPEFTWQRLPWKHNRPANLDLPSMTVVLNCYRVIRYVQPKYWLIENVQGALHFFNLFLPYLQHVGPRYLWGKFPHIDCPGQWNKMKIPGNCSWTYAQRSMIPDKMARAIYNAIK